MGDDFSALLEYRGIDAAVQRRPSSGGRSAAAVQRRPFSGGRSADDCAAGVRLRAAGIGPLRRPRPVRRVRLRRSPVRWYSADDFHPLPGRPALPDPDAQLGLRSGFSVTFGADAVWLYHLLRWQFFCDDPQWQAAMYEAVGWFRQAFGATDTVVTWD